MVVKNERKGFLEYLEDDNKNIPKFPIEELPIVTESLQKLEHTSNETEQKLITREKKDILVMRKYWSWGLWVAILVIVAFDMVIIILLGYKQISFDSNNYLAPIFIGESLLKIFGLAIIVVKFLFNINSHGLPKRSMS